MTETLNEDDNVLDIKMDQYATFSMQVAWTDENGAAVNTTGWTAAMQVREDYDSASALLDWTSADGEITVATNGVVTVEALVPGTITAPVDGVYDLNITSPDGFVKRLLRGCCCIRPGVTR